MTKFEKLLTTPHSEIELQWNLDQRQSFIGIGGLWVQSKYNVQCNWLYQKIFSAFTIILKIITFSVKSSKYTIIFE